MNGIPQVSVVLPTYNRALTIKRAVDSVLLQKGVHWELIIVDDGSNDSTRSMLKQYSGDSRIRVLKQSNRGVSSARNAGVAVAQGDYVALLDSDDEWLPGKLVAQMDYFKEAHYQIQQTEEIWYRHGRRINAPKYLLKKEGDIFDISLHRCMITPSSVCLTRSLFKKFGGFDESFPVCEDYELWLRITASNEVGLIRRNYLVRYAGLPDQLSFKYPAMDRFRIRAMVKLLEEGVLNLNQKRICLAEVEKKVNVYREGCRKRNKKTGVEWCDAIKKKYFGTAMKIHKKCDKN